MQTGEDFWGPFLWGLALLSLSGLLFVLLRLRQEWLISLRSRVARVLAWGLFGFLLCLFVLLLPNSLGLCRGGFSNPIHCELLPTWLAEVTFVFSFFGLMLSILLVPALIFVGALSELIYRLRSR